MNPNLNPNLIPPPGDTPKIGIPPLGTGLGTPQASHNVYLTQLLGGATGVDTHPLGAIPGADQVPPISYLSPPPDDTTKNGSPLSVNIGTNHGSPEARKYGGPTVSGSQLQSVPPNLAAFAAAAEEPLDPEDLTSFALPEDYNFSVAKKVLTSVQVKKPSKESFVRTNRDPATWKPYSLLELKEEGKIYLVSPPLAAALEAEGESTLTKALLVPTVDRRGNFFLWNLKLSDRESSWHLSGNRAAELAKTKWVRIQSNMSAGAYDTSVAENQDAQPVWPEEDFATILKIAFEGKVITSRDHPVLKELRGGN